MSVMNNLEASRRSKTADFAALGAGTLSTSVLVGYAIAYRPAYTLEGGMPAVHPLSAVCLLLLGFGLYVNRSPNAAIRFAGRAAVFVTACVAALRVMTPVVFSSLFDAVTPFRGVLRAELAGGHAVTMGIHTAHVLLMLVAGEVARGHKRPMLSQIFVCGAVTLLLMGIMGYAYGLPNFYGTMAPRTIVGALLLALSLLASTKNVGFIQPVTADSDPGRIARRLLCSSTPLIFLIGGLTVHYTRAYGVAAEAGPLIAYQTASIIIISSTLVIRATVRSDLIDRHRRSVEALLTVASATDTLTGLLSRNRLEQHRIVDDHGRSPPRTAELFIDLDRFRTVNDVFGNSTGDAFLVEIGRRLLTVARSYPVGRLGGDEFSVVCSDITLEEAKQIGSGVTAILSMPFAIQARTFHLTASVGVAHSDSAGDTRLQAAANSAMHVAKGRGGNQVVIFEDPMFRDRQYQIELEQHLFAALKQDNELGLAFQPIIDLKTRQLLAVEALARWTNPELGAVSPGRFIPVAEKSGLIIPLGSKLMALAVAQAAIWRDRYALNAPRINFNISPLQFGVGDVVGELKRLLDRYSLPTSAICIEVTEGAFADASALLSLQRAREMGFAVAMDDFGVGYSSLSQLPRLPIVLVKLDRSFIIDATKSAGGAHLLKSVVQLAHGLDLKVVAEGVETPSQRHIAADAGCDAVQGYLDARPMKAEIFEIWAAERAV